MDTTVTDPLLGALVDGRYRVRARLARGGMATVYTATDERLERTIALKIIQPTQARNRQFLTKFTDEAKTIARLTHPNVVAVYDQGTFQGLPYLVMEYVRGRTLREVLTERRRLSAAEALAILEQMLAAIAAAHRAGLVHRDVKPENVLVAEAPGSSGPGRLVDAVVKVADFGLARAVEASGEDRGGGHLMATVAYVAPELVTDGHADPRADVYSAGIVLFEMLTGRVPYEGNKPLDVAWQHVDRDVPAPSRYVAGLPAALDELVSRATRRDPGDRPTDAAALLSDVAAAREDLGSSASRARLAAQPTVVVPSLELAPRPNPHPTTVEDRPTWARLHPPPGRRRATAHGDAPPNFFTTLATKYRRHPRRREIAIIAAVLAGLMIITGTWWFTAGRYTTAPALVNMSKTQAIAAAKKAGLSVHYDNGLFSETITVDTVMKQRPAARARITRGGSIVLTLSRGPERYSVPDVVGISLEAAEAQLADSKMTVKKVEQYSDTFPAGTIMSTDPVANTVVKNGAEITVVVSKGRAPITVPPVVGKTLDESTQILTGMGLQVKTVPEASDLPANQVLKQDPLDGSGVEAGAVITLTISTGPPQQQVPDVTHQPCQDAANLLRQSGFNPQVIGFDSFSVINQQPGAGTQAPSGSTVTIWCFGG